MRAIETKNIGHVRTGPNGENSYEVKMATVDAGGDGNRVLIAAVAGKKIRVIGGKLWALADGTVQFLSTETALFTIPIDVAGGTGGGGGGVIDFNGSPWGAFETAVGGALEVTLSADTDLDGYLVYIEV